MAGAVSGEEVQHGCPRFMGAASKPPLKQDQALSARIFAAAAGA